MPQYHNWLQHIPLGNSERRKRDRQCKHDSMGKKRTSTPPALATYSAIDKHVYRKISAGGHTVRYYRLSDLAAIYGITTATVRRWYNARMLPEFFGDGNTYIKEQILVICNVLNDIFEQDVCHFRKSHTSHIEMMRAGNEMALRSIATRIAREPKQRLPILPHPREWKRLAEIRKARIYHVPYRPPRICGGSQLS